MNETHYDTLKRIGAIIVAVSLWFLSIRFSVDGFSIQVPNMAWAGWVLAFAVTVIELIFTSENRGKNITLMVVGIAAYTYGVWSNIVGIYATRGAAPDGAGLMNTNLIFSVILGLILEIAPEPLFLWGLLGSETGEGDFVASLARIWNSMQPRQSNHNREFQNQEKRPVGRPRKYPLDTVSSKPPNYMAHTRLNILEQMNSGTATLIWDKNKSQSPTLIVPDQPPSAVSRSLIRQMVDEKALIEKQRGSMITEYIVSGSEPPERR